MKVSLILTTFNSAANLSGTLKSIEEQDYPDIEVVIKDGGSTDGTLKLIRSFEKRSRFPVRFTSSPDTGIYDAMNQGYALSTGDVIVFFNDLFTSKSSVSKIMNLLASADAEDVAGAHADLVYAEGERIVRYWHMGPQKPLFTGWMPGHPTLFLKRRIYETYGLYDTSLRISADYEYIVRFLKDKKNRLVYLPETIIRMYYGGTSNQTFGSYVTSFMEGTRGLIKNGVRPAFLISCFRTVRVLLQFVRKRRP
ncbi:MAG: glycosyltransferase [Lachnospiraceae bacterium]|nr:glycosyltransferase [Lachnospiraceae bacterium]